MRLLVLDLDGTLWDHEDASRMVPPFEVYGNRVVDAYGRKLELFEGVKEFLDWASEHFILSIASWNVEDVVKLILESLGLWEYFLFPKIENHPNKADMIERTLEQLTNAGYKIDEVIYVDDRTLHIEDIKRRMPNVKFIHMWVDVKSFEELKSVLEGL
ncbi:Magnesium-dependent phosphatase [Palaeococcus pacificus DY20341]|uniref:Magnesium-dependent phosphatase n=1 Tax=Palaeococcus pacificus DY20341 TaxID=1343739 RepID=A0A075LVN9_9EURY|nr:magnesium-dependent phosphatase-1 [Palaeococcus pacificus]AIF70077.1 Magnesium-dependent phosphatase [Palaeococcus pacificus DY20341]